MLITGDPMVTPPGFIAVGTTFDEIQPSETDITNTTALGKLVKTVRGQVFIMPPIQWMVPEFMRVAYPPLYADGYIERSTWQGTSLLYPGFKHGNASEGYICDESDPRYRDEPKGTSASFYRTFYFNSYYVYIDQFTGEPKSKWEADDHRRFFVNCGVVAAFPSARLYLSEYSRYTPPVTHDCTGEIGRAVTAADGPSSEITKYLAYIANSTKIWFDPSMEESTGILLERPYTNYTTEEQWTHIEDEKDVPMWGSRLWEPESWDDKPSFLYQDKLRLQYKSTTPSHAFAYSDFTGGLCVNGRFPRRVWLPDTFTWPTIVEDSVRPSLLFHILDHGAANNAIFVASCDKAPYHDEISSDYGPAVTEGILYSVDQRKTADDNIVYFTGIRGGWRMLHFAFQNSYFTSTAGGYAYSDISRSDWRYEEDYFPNGAYPWHKDDLDRNLSSIRGDGAVILNTEDVTDRIKQQICKDLRLENVEDINIVGITANVGGQNGISLPT